MAGFYALIIRTPDVDEDEETDKNLKENEQFLHKHYTGIIKGVLIFKNVCVFSEITTPASVILRIC